MKLATIAQDNVFTNYTIRTDFTVGSDLGVRVNNGGRMMHRISNEKSALWNDFKKWKGHSEPPIRSQVSTNINVTSASLTTSSFTRHTPLALPIFPRALINSTVMTSVSPGRTGLRHFTLSAE